MTIEEVQKLAKKLERLDQAYSRIGNCWSEDQYIRDLLRDKIIQEKAWLLDSVAGQIIEVKV